MIVNWVFTEILEIKDKKKLDLKINFIVNYNKLCYLAIKGVKMHLFIISHIFVNKFHA